MSNTIHFGPIPAENDPSRNQGVLVDRMDCRQWGAHLPHVTGIDGQSKHGAQSVALSGGYKDDEDRGEWFLYTCSGGRDRSGIQGFVVCKYLFVRCDNEPAPWTSDEHGDRPRPLPVPAELKGAFDITERKGSPSWDIDATQGRWRMA